MRKTHKKNRYQKVTWAEAFRDIVIASMNKGQFLLLTVVGVFFTIIVKMPEKDVSKLMFAIVDRLAEWELMAYILLTVVLAAWYVHAKAMRTIFSDECRRIGKEKPKLQSKRANTIFKSSE